MDAVFDLLDDVFGDNLILSVLVFLAGATVAFGVMATLQVRRGVRRRAAGVFAGASSDSPSMRHAHPQAAPLLMDYPTRHFSRSQKDAQRALNRRLPPARFSPPPAPPLP